MKDIRQYITEEIKSYDKGIIDMLNFFAKNCSGVQKELFNQKVKDAFAAMTTGPSSLKTALEKAVESYGTVSSSIAGELGELAQGGGEGGQ